MAGKERERSGKKHKKHKSTKAVEYSASRVYRTLYGLGVGLMGMSFIMSCLAHANNLSVCRFGYPEPGGPLVSSFFTGNYTKATKNQRKAFVFSFGLWQYCAFDECKMVQPSDDGAQVGELNSELIFLFHNISCLLRTPKYQ